jgi:hypothetical protein
MRVTHIASQLRKSGFKHLLDVGAFDFRHFDLSVNHMIRNSHFFMVFLTASCNEKIRRTVKPKEWLEELKLASSRVPPMNIIIVVLEEAVRNRSAWAPFLRFFFAGAVVYDLSESEKSRDWPKLLKMLRTASLSVNGEFLLFVPAESNFVVADASNFAMDEGKQEKHYTVHRLKSSNFPLSFEAVSDGSRVFERIVVLYFLFLYFLSSSFHLSRHLSTLCNRATISLGPK